MRVSVLLSSNGAAAQTIRSLESIAATIPPAVSFDVVFVDNGSRDGTAGLLQQVAGDFLLLRNEHDRGFEAAVGQAALHARGDIVIAMRPGVTVRRGWIEPLIQSLRDDPQANAVRPHVVCAGATLLDDCCVAVRGTAVQEIISREPIALWAVDHERAGHLLLDLGRRARLEPRSTVSLEAAPEGDAPTDRFERTWDELGSSSGGPVEELFWEGLVRRRPDRSQVTADLQLLNDVLATSALAGRYWITSGMLIGWARDRDLIPGDLHDFDFAFRDADFPRFRNAMLDLVHAGFLPRYRFPTVFEPLTVLSLVRHGTKFEFFRLDEIGPEQLAHRSYGHLDGIPLENKHSDWRQRLVPIEFLDRVWLKSEDHELELEHEYGDWRTPDPDWDYMRAHNIIGRAPWNPEAYDFLRVAIH